MPEELSPKWDGLAPAPRLEEYAERLEDFFVMRRRDGILEARIHTDGGPYRMSFPGHASWGQAWAAIGSDPENEVLIITGTGDQWYTSDPTFIDKPTHEESGDHLYRLYNDTIKLLENLVFGVDIPTIGAINGPAQAHTEFALACDITLCAEDATFSTTSFSTGVTPGDGMALVLQELLGTKRGAYLMYTGEPIDAATALELGLVNEVHPRQDLLPRAWELAEMIMRRPRNARRMTHALATRPLKRRLVHDAGFHAAHEFFSILADKPVGKHGGHNLEPLD